RRGPSAHRKISDRKPHPTGNNHTQKSRPPWSRPFGSGAVSAPERMDQAAASLSFLSGRTLTLTEAGLAANHCSSLVKGLMPLRRGLAGTFCEVILSMPGRVNEPTPRLLSEPAMVSSSEASTARTSLAATPLVSAMCEIRPDLVSVSLIAFGAAAFLATAFFAAGFLVVAFFAASFAVFPVPWWMVEWAGRSLGIGNVGQVRARANREPQKDRGFWTFGRCAAASGAAWAGWPQAPGGHEQDRGA